MTNSNILRAKEYFYKKDYNSALELFVRENDSYASGLCSLLLKDEKKAEEYWKQNKKNCPACAFGLCILDYINLKEGRRPAFFQTRAFLEVYLNLFIENGLIEWAQNLVNCCDKFYMSNPEAYKFIARALYSNGYFDLAIIFCKKSLKIFYSDPEALLILSQCQFLKGEIEDAMDSVNKILSLVNNYFPALLFKNIIKEHIDNKN